MDNEVLIEGIPAVSADFVKKTKILSAICFVSILLIPLGFLFLFNIKLVEDQVLRTKLIVTKKNIFGKFGDDNDTGFDMPIESIKEVVRQRSNTIILVTVKGAYAVSHISNCDEVVSVINKLLVDMDFPSEVKMLAQEQDDDSLLINDGKENDTTLENDANENSHIKPLKIINNT